MQIFLTNSLIERAEHLAYSNPTFEANTNEVTERMYQAKLLRLGRQTCGKVKVKCDVPKFKLVEATFALHGMYNLVPLWCGVGNLPAMGCGRLRVVFWQTKRRTTN